MDKKHIIYIVSGTVVLLCIVIILCMRSCGRNSKAEGEEQIAQVDTLGLMITQIQNCSRLYTAEYKVHKIITHEDESRIKGKILGQDVDIPVSIGERMVAIPMFATVKASIDLSKVEKKDIEMKEYQETSGDKKVTRKKIEVFLPQPEVEITETHIDNNGIKQHVSLLRQNFSDKELLDYEQQGRASIEKDVPNMNIMQMARVSAAHQLIPIMEKLGYKQEDITISFRTDYAKILKQNK